MSALRVARRALSSVAPSVLAGGMIGIAVAGVSREPGAAGFIVVLPVLGLATVGLVRLFPVARWAWPICGALAGPVPAVLLAANAGPEERKATLVLGMAFGALIGLLEWARAARREELDRRGAGGSSGG